MGGDGTRKPPHDLVKFLDLKPAGLEHIERAWQGSLFRLRFIDNLFGEFVSWTAPGERDRDFRGRSDQKGSQIGNSRWLIELRYENSSFDLSRPTCQDRIDSLVQSHKPSGGFLMRNSNGPALRDLPQENRDDAAGRSDNVTEADCIHAACGTADPDHSQLREAF